MASIRNASVTWTTWQIVEWEIKAAKKKKKLYIVRNVVTGELTNHPCQEVFVNVNNESLVCVCGV